MDVPAGSQTSTVNCGRVEGGRVLARWLREELREVGAEPCAKEIGVLDGLDRAAALTPPFECLDCGKQLQLVS